MSLEQALQENTAALRALTTILEGAAGAGKDRVVNSATPAPAPATPAPAPAAPAPAPAAPAPAPAAPAPAPAAPAPAPSFTQITAEELNSALVAEFQRLGGRDKIDAVFKELGVASITALDPARYNEVLAKVKALT